jgi:hypothetical protein
MGISMKFKLSNKSRVLLITGVFLIAVFSLSLVQLNQIQARTRAEQEMAQTSLLIEKLNIGNALASQKEELQGRIKTASANMEQEKIGLQQSLETIENSGDIYDIARRSYVSIVGIDSSKVSEKEIGGVKAAEINVNIRATGTMSNLISFVYDLTAKYRTGEITSVQITAPVTDSVSDDTSGTVGPVETPQISVAITIYDCKGG